jgi:hypothetical protein
LTAFDSESTFDLAVKSTFSEAADCCAKSTTPHKTPSSCHFSPTARNDVIALLERANADANSAHDELRYAQSIAAAAVLTVNGSALDNAYLAAVRSSCVAAGAPPELPVTGYVIYVSQM